MCDDLDKELEEIMRIVNIDHTKPTANTQQKQQPQKGTSRHSQRGQSLRYSSSGNERSHRVAKRRKQHMLRRWTIIGCVIAVLVLIVFLICKSCAGGKSANVDLAGVWYYDQYTEYEFDGSGNGCMCLDGNSHYEFSYQAKEGSLYLDFALVYVTDCQYTYTIDGGKLTLVGGEGTAEIGKVYELTKVK